MLLNCYFCFLKADRVIPAPGPSNICDLVYLKFEPLKLILLIL